MKTMDLCGEWILQDETGRVYSGNVPGCVHTDLFSEDELYKNKNSLNCRFVEEQNWKYTKCFYIDQVKENTELVFEGLDTYCEIHLNGKKLGCADNMFIPHVFSVDEFLKSGENKLEVLFFSPVKMVEGKELLSGAFTTDRLHSRRIQCTYGWDWVDRFVTCGIYRPVYLNVISCAELENVYVFTENVDAFSAQIKIAEHFRYPERNAQGAYVQTEIICPDGAVIWENTSWCEEAESVLYADIVEPRLWYPRPYGEQPLYTLRVTVSGECREVRFGIRTVKILQVKDTCESDIMKCRALQQTQSGREWDENETFSGFIPIVNGKRIFCSGANWVPCEPFPSAESDEKITKILKKAAEANVNMIRVWGGGIFEKQHFYDMCDQLGILVTQDFLMACGKYPETDPWFQEQLRKEAEFAAVSLRNHPCLVWWSGDNENAVAGSDECREYKGRISARKIIAPILEKLDYSRRFLFSSPYGGKRYASKTAGTTHNTQFLNVIMNYVRGEDLSDYKEYWKEYIARFVAEEPAMGAIDPGSLEKFMDPEYQDDWECWLHHTKTNPALGFELLDLFTGFAEKLFGTFEDWNDQYFKMRYLQYEWIRMTMNHARSNLWFQSGIIYWMLNDCWPASFGWSLYDYYVREKAGVYAMKHFANPISVSLEKEEDGIGLYVSSILPDPHNCKVTVMRIDLELGNVKILKEHTVCLTSEVQRTAVWEKPGERQILVAQVTEQKSDMGELVQRNWYKEGCPKLKKTEAFTWNYDGQAIHIYAEKYIHVVEVHSADVLEDQYFSLLPGEKRVINCTHVQDTANVNVTCYTF